MVECGSVYIYNKESKYVNYIPAAYIVLLGEFVDECEERMKEFHYLHNESGIWAVWRPFVWRGGHLGGMIMIDVDE